MKCKFCDALIDDDAVSCPVCGKELNENIEEETAAEETQPAEPVADTEPKVEENKKKSVAPLVLSIIAAVAALASLAILLLMALGIDLKSYLPRPNDILNKDSYVVVDDKAEKQGDDVIATIGDKQLTNVQLQIYYRMQVMDLLNYYGSYISQIGLDTSLPLSDQSCYFDDTMSWEQYLLKISIETWQNYQIIGLLAEEADFTLDAEWEESLTNMPADLLEQAKESGFETAEELLADVIGPTCTLDEYMEYVRLAYLSNAYYNTLNEKNIPTAEEIDTYFEQNKDVLAEEGITKDMGNIANVRHILLMPKGGVENEETGETEYSEADMKACYKEAEKILNEWKAGEATEESFGELANKYTEDEGSSTTGGLYEGVAPGSNYVENFLDWSIDMNRKEGETGIVETEFGYHIMYYVSGTPYWSQVVETQMIADRITAMTDEAEAKWPMEVNYRKIAISELNIG